MQYGFKDYVSTPDFITKYHICYKGRFYNYTETKDKDGNILTTNFEREFAIPRGTMSKQEQIQMLDDAETFFLNNK
jgi:hypothetical protein